MNVWAAHFLWVLLQASAAMTATGFVLFAALRLFRVESPRLHRWACVIILLEGCGLVGIPIGVELPTAERVLGEARGKSAHGGLMEGSWPTGVISGSDYRLGNARDVNVAPAAARIPRPLAPEPSNAFRRSTTLSPALWLVLLWAGGGLGLIGWTAWNCAAFARTLSETEMHDAARHAEWTAEWRALLQTFGVPAELPLVTTRGVGPALCRLPGGYRLLVPLQLWNTLTAAQRDAVLRHELAHYVRGDIWKSAVVRMVATLHWFNPMAWWAVGRFEESAEWACDEQVRAVSRARMCDLAQVLLRLGGGGHRGPTLASPVRGNGLPGRIRRLVKQDFKEDSGMKRTAMVLILVMAGAGGMLRLHVRADEPQTASRVQDAVRQTGERPNTPMPDEATAESAGREAVIDLGRVFKEDVRFEARRKRMLHEQARHRTELEKRIARRHALHRQVEELRKRNTHLTDEVRRRVDELELELRAAEADIEARTTLYRDQLKELETKAYAETYDRIVEEVRRYAREQGLRSVRRLRGEPTTERGGAVDRITWKAAPSGLSKSRDTKRAVSYVERPEPHDPARALIVRMNQDVLYESAESKSVDITDAIIGRLNTASAAAAEKEEEEQ